MMDKCLVKEQCEGVPLQKPIQSFSRTVIKTANKETIKNKKRTIFT